MMQAAYRETLFNGVWMLLTAEGREGEEALRRTIRHRTCARRERFARVCSQLFSPFLSLSFLRSFRRCSKIDRVHSE